MILISCAKEDAPPHAANLDMLRAAKDFLKDIKPDSTADYYISGEFDGHYVYLTTKGETGTYTDSVANAWYINDNIQLDNMHLIRMNHEQTVLVAIYFTDAKRYFRELPYILPHNNTGVYEFAQMEMVNMKRIGFTGKGAPDDNFSFFGNTSQGLKMQVSSFADNVVEGTFEGALTTRTGTSINVKNGKFRIRFYTVNWNMESAL